MKKKIIILLVMFIIAGLTFAAELADNNETEVIKDETRYMHAVWYNLYDESINIHDEEKAKEQIDIQLKKFKTLGINTVFLLVKLPDGRVYYPSKYSPQVNKWDSLSYIILKCHEYGMEIHPYLNVMCDTGYLAEHPEYAEYTNDGEALKWVSPAIPEVKERFINIVKELIENYEIDGLQLDRIRYYTPQEIKEETRVKTYPKGFILDTGYNNFSLALYKEKYGKEASSDDSDFRQFKNDLVTSFVLAAKEVIKSEKPKLKFSCSVYASPGIAVEKGCFQQWDKWFNEGIVDFIVTMSYNENYSRFNFYITDTIARLDFSKSKLVTGIGAYMIRRLPAEERKAVLKKEIDLVMATKQISGICYFNGFSILNEEMSNVVGEYFSNNKEDK